MKRDLDLYRQLLLDIEEQNDAENLGWSPDLNAYPDHSDAAVYVHLELLIDRGLVVGDCTKVETGEYIGASIKRLTDEGHDLLDSIRDDTVYRRTVEKISSAVGSASVEVVKAVAQGVTKAMIEAP